MSQNIEWKCFLVYSWHLLFEGCYKNISFLGTKVINTFGLLVNLQNYIPFLAYFMFVIFFTAWKVFSSLIKDFKKSRQIAGVPSVLFWRVGAMVL